MKSVLPFPLVSASLLLLWMLLNQSLSPGQILIGCAVALTGGRILTRLQLPQARIRRPAVAVRLAGLVIADIIRSNIAVARIILGIGAGHRTSGFVNISLDLRDPYGLACLAGIITATPGTLWVNFDGSEGVLTMHVLDLIDEAAWVETIKGRYERHLLEIFTSPAAATEQAA
ncbi:MAG: Na+/H+ antiporter subunit E [Alphaproteobacteria bacterium]|nr:Na+/H+ antiporter subunit E [Alphaproteobacteria bacterium]